MSDIGTHKQVVDPDKFNPNFDAAITRKPAPPGKTKYVMRNGELVKKDDGIFRIPSLPTGYLEMREGLKRDGLHSPSPELLRTLADQS